MQAPRIYLVQLQTQLLHNEDRPARVITPAPKVITRQSLGAIQALALVKPP